MPKIGNLDLVEDLSSGKEVSGLMGKVGCQAPKLLEQKKLHNSAVDMWREGAILYKILIARFYKLPQDKTTKRHKNQGPSRPKRPSISGRFSKE
ncbi:hypothetical protein EC957_009669, partial [Mortierella hygrophila]